MSVSYHLLVSESSIAHTNSLTMVLSRRTGLIWGGLAVSSCFESLGNRKVIRRGSYEADRLYAGESCKSTFNSGCGGAGTPIGCDSKKAGGIRAGLACRG